MRYILILAFLCVQKPALAQRIDQTALFRNVAGDKYVRLHYDNDFFAKSDYYYTQGYSFELITPGLRKNPLNKLLLRTGRSMQYGLAFEHYGFTPTSISSDAILYNDRPFAGCIMLKSFRISVDTLKKTRLVAILSTGMIGPVAFAGKMQTKIHEWTGDRDPRGWQNQIKNDLIINYAVQFQKQVFNYKNHVALNTETQMQMGTLTNKAQAGLTVRLGKFYSPFDNAPVKLTRKLQCYIYNQPLIGFNAYDATLQGGLFSTNSPYKLRSSQINRVTFQDNFGLVVQYWRIYLEYYQSFLTREFHTGMDHRWGGVKVGIAL
ncbi:lipid A deacylase LpxR family protein [Dyadobacter fanqingshengii]|uniref:Lipid A deacylase LpxR family protein n=1 Tax=Dyadobacter fanqingshengii TaxID=2906443 RepID=A0A9X1PDD8_9BACT|nr:lipid A deacylase LpxR family protein [Dyadobacter fanqingshengii]MCF0042926.1 lipid A deacylase LpxR family protein [Dyadobacter fanqingshengii]USJ35481.1 lipid A deacylase LpxR family protein [Dyadobacter fanqingshengii]